MSQTLLLLEETILEKNIKKELDALRAEIREMVQTATNDVLKDVHALLKAGQKTV